MTHHQPPAAALDRATTRAFDQPGGGIEATLKANPEQDRRTRRDQVWQLLQSTIHYAHCAQLHLESDDDTPALYDLRTARDYFTAAIREFAPLRQGLAERICAQEAAA